jgi:hypothetical protein
MSSSDGPTVWHDPAAAAAAVELLRTVLDGTRVVVRSRLPGGLTDTVGRMVARTDRDIVLVTKSGDEVTVPLSAVVLAKIVSSPPMRRRRD